ncbi:MAG: Gldg family protein, partial [Pseudomonadota bacterium]
PKELSPGTQFAIDQFVMRGGKAVIFVDPVAAIDAEPQPGMPPGMPAPAGSSNLPLLFEGWGIDYDPQQVVADARLALPVGAGFGSRPVRHYGYLGITPEFMSTDDVVTMELGAVNAAMPGQLGVNADSNLTLEPLLRASPASATLPASRFSFLPDPSTLQDGFSPGGEALVIAARISGALPSAFPDGAPADTVDSGGPDAAAGPEPAATPAHLGESAEPANLIVVADVDLLSDPLWVQTQSFFGQQIANAFAGNGALVVNALENLAGSADLIAVRSRGSFSRPFTTVDELRAQAEARFRATEERLQQELAETERRLGELQSSREDTGSLLLTPEQQAEIDRFVEQRASIRRELRAVQRGLDEDIENLGTVLKVLNIGLVPLLLTLVALFAVWRRRRREAA